MDILLVVVIGIIVAVISAATKKKPQKQDDEQQRQQPARPHISDIQRAFMLLDDFDKGAAPPAQTPPSAQRQNADAMPSSQGTSSWDRSPHPGAMESTEGHSSWDGARHRETPQPAKPKRPQQRPASTKPLGAVPTKYANVQLNRMDDAEDDEKALTRALQHRKHKSRLALRFGKDELVNAVIYSEILARKY